MLDQHSTQRENHRWNLAFATMMIRSRANLLHRCFAASSQIGKKTIIRVPELKSLLSSPNRDLIDFVDVRTVAEFQELHLPGFKNIPLDTFSPSKACKSGRKVLLMCKAGIRAELAADLAVADGHEVYVLQDNWQDSDLPKDSLAHNH